MSVGGQAQSGKQSGSTSNNSSGTNNATTNSTGTSATTGTQTGTQAGQNTVQTTDGWSSVSDILRNMVSGGGGLTPQQTAAMGTISDSANGAASAMDYGGKVLSQYVGDNHDPYQISAADKIVAPQASSYMGDYANPFENQVVDATRDDLTQGFRTGLNELRSSYGGAMGNGREGVAAGTAADNFDRTLGTTLGNLRSQGFNTALNAGEGDATRQLAANTGNVQNKIGVDQFNTGQKNVNDQQSIGVVNDWIQQQLAKNGAVGGAATTNAGISQGGTGNLFSFLNSQAPAFGNSSTGSSTGTSSSNTNTTMQQIMSSLFSGQSSGTSSGSSSSKGGGAQVPIF